jgi:type IV secretory pathway component VirB8
VTTRTEPNVLQTKITIFVLTGLVLTLGILLVTVYKMFPLNRPQIFFLRSVNRDNQDVQIINKLQKSDKMLQNYKVAFINEYIQHRNEIHQNRNVMEKKWNASDGAIRIWSDDKVYEEFSKTKAFKRYMNAKQSPNVTCGTNVTETLPLTADVNTPNKERYQVGVIYSCVDKYGYTTQTSYKIHVDIATDNTTLRWKNRLDNPLGLKVVQYKVVDGQTDPLDTEQK